MNYKFMPKTNHLVNLLVFSANRTFVIVFNVSFAIISFCKATGTVGPIIENILVVFSTWKVIGHNSIRTAANFAHSSTDTATITFIVCESDIFTWSNLTNWLVFTVIWFNWLWTFITANFTNIIFRRLKNR